MKRHRALHQLSRDHHHALVVAQRLKRSEDESALGARDAFLDYWHRDGREHFQEEEEILLPACAGYLDVRQSIFAEVLTDHVRIRHLAAELGENDRPVVGALHELGLELERHVRREERELFPLIERSLPEDELRRLGELLGS
jgi:iron-sulfur cluster repair protein YtfE (RIC family)